MDIQEKRFVRLAIELMDVKPKIWRRFWVPADISLDRLHDVIQIVMGWQDCHLHNFVSEDGRHFTENPAEQLDFDLEYLDESVFRLDDLLKKKGDSLHYEYDLGDGWEHLITLDSTRNSRMDPVEELFCSDGKRACPPEDVGGAGGYEEFLKAIKGSDTEERQMYLNWAGGDFDSNEFDTDAVNERLFWYTRWSRKRKIG